MLFRSLDCCKNILDALAISIMLPSMKSNRNVYRHMPIYFYRFDYIISFHEIK